MTSQHQPTKPIVFPAKTPENYTFSYRESSSKVANCLICIWKMISRLKHERPDSHTPHDNSNETFNDSNSKIVMLDHPGWTKTSTTKKEDNFFIDHYFFTSNLIHSHATLKARTLF